MYTDRRLLTFRRNRVKNNRKSSKQNAVYWLLAWLNPSTLMMETVESIETLGYFHQATSRLHPKYGIVQIRRHENVESFNFRTTK
jgi:hypothetical protein